MSTNSISKNTNSKIKEVFNTGQIVTSSSRYSTKTQLKLKGSQKEIFAIAAKVLNTDESYTEVSNLGFWQRVKVWFYTRGNSWTTATVKDEEGHFYKVLVKVSNVVEKLGFSSKTDAIEAAQQGKLNDSLSHRKDLLIDNSFNLAEIALIEQEIADFKPQEDTRLFGEPKKWVYELRSHITALIDSDKNDQRPPTHVLYFNHQYYLVVPTNAKKGLPAIINLPSPRSSEKKEEVSDLTETETSTFLRIGRLDVNRSTEERHHAVGATTKYGSAQKTKKNS